jgi:hypothetical protein
LLPGPDQFKGCDFEAKVRRMLKTRRRMWRRRRKLRSKLLRRRLRKEDGDDEEDEEDRGRKEIGLKGGKHDRVFFYHFLTKNHLGIFVSLPPNHHGKCYPNFIKWDSNQFKKQFKKGTVYIWV